MSGTSGSGNGSGSGSESGSGSASGAGSVSDALTPLVDALTAAGKAAGVESSGDANVLVAVKLGWLMRELKEGRPLEPLPADLALSDDQQRRAQACQLETLLGALKPPGLEASAVKAVTDALAKGPAKTEAAALEPGIVVGLVAGNVRFSRAYALGDGLRALIPAATSGGDQRAAGDDAIRALVGALDALSSSLPSHAARGVANSMSAWSQSKDLQEKRALARAQVILWRSVIVGAKKGTELLEPDDYIDAARQLERRFLSRAVRSPWLILSAIFALGLFAAGVYFLFAANGQASKLAAGASGVLAGLGLTWKGIGGTVGKFVGKLEAPLWGAELDTAVTFAITLVSDPKQKPAKPPAALSYADRRARAMATSRTTPAERAQAPNG